MLTLVVTNRKVRIKGNKYTMTVTILKGVTNNVDTSSNK